MCCQGRRKAARRRRKLLLLVGLSVATAVYWVKTRDPTRMLPDIHGDMATAEVPPPSLSSPSSAAATGTTLLAGGGAAVKSEGHSRAADTPPPPLSVARRHEESSVHAAQTANTTEQSPNSTQAAQVSCVGMPNHCTLSRSYWKPVQPRPLLAIRIPNGLNTVLRYRPRCHPKNSRL
jgi:hypothetical protein